MILGKGLHKIEWNESEVFTIFLEQKFISIRNFLKAILKNASFLQNEISTDTITSKQFSP